MSGEELFKAINVDGSNDREKRRVTLNGVECGKVGEFVCWRSWNRRLVKGDEGESRAWIEFPFCPDQVSDILRSQEPMVELTLLDILTPCGYSIDTLSRRVYSCMLNWCWGIALHSIFDRDHAGKFC